MNSNFDPYEVINRTNEIERAQMIKEKNDCYNIPEHLLDFFDLERYGRYCGDYNVYECENGLIEIY